MMLEQKGFTTVGVDETDQAIHALIYSTATSNGGYIAHAENLEISGNNKYVILINADEYTEDEIVDIIQ